MSVHIFNSEGKMMNDDVINESYALYLHKFIEDCSRSKTTEEIGSCAIMSHDEFKEYYILEVLGRSGEFTANLARDFQYLSFENTLMSSPFA